MGVSVLVLGPSGSGKSTSMRNFAPDEVGIFNVASKPLPFRGSLPKVDAAGYDVIKRGLAGNNRRAYVIDDANYLMAFENFAKAHQSGFGKFTDMAVNFEQLLEVSNFNTSSDTITYFFMHPDYDDAGRMKPKTIGKMLDNQLTVEGMFPIVLLAVHDNDGYGFLTADPGNTPVKAPMGMFDSPRIDNDLKAVDSIIRDYWGMAPIVDTPSQTEGESGEAE